MKTSNASGKLIVTEYKGRYLTLLFQDNQLLTASVSEEKPSKVDNIYIGKVKKVVKNINACFVEIDDGEICFLPIADCKTPFLLNRPFNGRILEGDELLVQVIRDSIKTKQAAVTTKLSLKGTYWVFSIGSSKIGISNKIKRSRSVQLLKMLINYNIIDSNEMLLPIEEKQIKLYEDKNDISTDENEKVDEEKVDEDEKLERKVKIPNFGVVLRTAADKASNEDILEEFYILYQEFIDIFLTAIHRTCFTCLKKAEVPYFFDIEDIYPEEYNEVVTDLEYLYNEIKEYIHVTRKRSDVPVRLYKDTSYPLHKLYSIESRLMEAVSPRVWLKSGGYLVIEPTEALTVIDVNSGKYQGKKDIRETFYQINKEAAEEIALQLRLRNLSGIIIVDFISMQTTRQQNQLLEYLKQLVSRERIKTKVIGMTPLGLVEITRKKVKKPLIEQLYDK